MTWFTVLKMPNPFGGTWQTLTSSEYYKMDNTNKQRYHNQMALFYNRQLKQAVTPRKAGQAPPATDDQIRGLRELQRFHSRQKHRLKTNSPKDTYYSLDEEQNRKMVKPQYDAVERMPHTTKEMYDKYSREKKIQYWGRLYQRLKTEYGQTAESTRNASKIFRRMMSNPSYTASFEDNLTTEEYGDKYRFRDISEYDNFTPEEKRKYHNRIMTRKRKNNDKSGEIFHSRMKMRIINNSPLPTYPTPEAEKEAEEE
jgi:hypothetical protein|tara:strand:- start:378 stop:1142 length:765 start_codon:yes stop_codon:yes gene_type:complete